MSTVKAEVYNLMMDAQKTIEQMSAMMEGNSMLPEQFQQRISTIIIDTQAILGMMATSQEHGLPIDSEIALLTEYHSKNTGLLADLAALRDVVNAA